MLRIFRHWTTPWILALISYGVSLIPENKIWLPSIILWIIAGIWFLIIIIYIIRNRKDNQKDTNNWIAVYKKRNKELPPIPTYLLPVVIGSKQDDLISREIKLRPMSGQFWNNLLPSQKDELRQVVEWLGENWDDYYEQMRRMLPKDLNLGSRNKPFEQH